MAGSGRAPLPARCLRVPFSNWSLIHTGHLNDADTQRHVDIIGWHGKEVGRKVVGGKGIHVAAAPRINPTS
jgi:hypothetical protein